MGKLKRAALLGAVAGAAAYAVKSYLDRSAQTDGGEVQISFEDGASETLTGAEAEEFADIARGVLRVSGR